ncbi:hypothetical protein T439DRAFT_298458 [Meredithblackwellia eburnea MCA 4105]
MSSSDSDEERSTTQRKSTRDRKKPERLDPSQKKRKSDISSSNGKSSKRQRRAQSSADSDEDADDDQNEEDDEEEQEEDQSEDDEDEVSDDEDFAAPKKSTAAKGKGRGKGKARVSAAGAGRGAADGPASSKGKKPAALRKKKGASAAAGQGAEGDGQEDGPASTAVTKGDVVVEADNTLYNAIRNPNSALQTVVDDWVESYQQNAGPAMAELINFVLRACGCNASIDEHQALDENGIVDVLDEIQNDFKNSVLLAYPLISKSKPLKKLRASLTSFLTRLFEATNTSEILYDEVFCQTFQSWLTSLSSSKIRSFRHTATVIALLSVAALSEVAREVEKEFGAASRAKEAEEKKGRKDKSRLKELAKAAAKVHERKTTVEGYLDELFASVFVNRYRDFEPVIRAECIKALGQWMKSYPEYWLEGNFLRYHGWVLSDDHKDVRHEAVKALISIYAKPDHIGSMKNFTDRFKGQLVNMATKEVDLSVRIACIHVVRQIDGHGLLDDGEGGATGGHRDSVALLVFEEEKRVRVAVAEFFQGLLKERVEEVEEEVDAANGGELEGKQWRDQLWLKSLAELFVRLGKKLDGFGDDEEGARDNEEDEDAQDGSAAAAVVLEDGRIGGTELAKGRIAFAVEALWEHVPAIRDWYPLLEFLLLDHSTEEAANGSGNDATPRKGKKPAGRGRKSRGGVAGAAGAGAVIPACRLTEDEETLLIEILVASLVRATEAAKKEKDNKGEQEMTEITRAVIDKLSTLFTKHQAVAARVVDILVIPTLISLDLYLDMQQITAYETLWDDITKQFVQHADVQVIEQAVRTMCYLASAKSLGNTNSTKLTELEETLVGAIRDAVADKDVETAAFDEDELLSLTSWILRVSRLYAARDLTAAVTEGDGKSSSILDVAKALLERGRLGYKDEVQIVEYALNLLGSHFIWSVGTLVDGPEGHFEDAEIHEIVESRNALMEKLEELSVGTNANAAEGVKRAALVLLMNIYILCDSVTSPENDPEGRFANFKMTCSDELQSRCAGFVEAEIERYSEVMAEDEEQEEEQEEQEDEEENSDEDDSDRRKKKKQKEAAVAKKKAERLKAKAALSATPAGIRAANARKRARLVAAGLFDRTAGAFVRALHQDIISLQHASVVLTHYERFDAVYDNWAKLLVQDIRDEGIYGKGGKLAVRVIVDSLKGACELFLDSPSSTDDHLVGLSRLLSGAVAVRGAQLAIVKRLHSTFHIQLHTDALDYILKKYIVLKDSKRKDASNRALLFFKALANLLIGIDGQSALKIKTSLDSLLDAADIQVLAAAKAWEPVRGYQKRLVTAMSKDPTLKTAAKAQVQRAKAQTSDDEIEDENVPPAKAKGKGKVITNGKGRETEREETDFEGSDNDEEVLPTRRKRAAAADTDGEGSREMRTNGASPKKRKVTQKGPPEVEEEDEPDTADENEMDVGEDPDAEVVEAELMGSPLKAASLAGSQISLSDVQQRRRGRR